MARWRGRSRRATFALITLLYDVVWLALRSYLLTLQGGAPSKTKTYSNSEAAQALSVLLLEHSAQMSGSPTKGACRAFSWPALTLTAEFHQALAANHGRQCFNEQSHRACISHGAQLVLSTALSFISLLILIGQGGTTAAKPAIFRPDLGR